VAFLSEVGTISDADIITEVDVTAEVAAHIVSYLFP